MSFCSGIHQLRFQFFYLIIHPIKPVIKVCLSSDIMSVIGIEVINFLNQLRFDGIILTELFFIIGYLWSMAVVSTFMLIFSCIIAAKWGLLTSFTITSATASSRVLPLSAFCNRIYAPAAYHGVYTHNRRNPLYFVPSFLYLMLLFPYILRSAYRTLHNPRKQMRPLVLSPY